MAHAEHFGPIGTADPLAPGHEIQVDPRPPPTFNRPVERLLGLVGGRGSCTHPSRFAMRWTWVSTQMLSGLRWATIITRFAVFLPTPGNVSSSSIVAGTLPAEARHDQPAGVLHVPGLVPVEADGIDEALDLPDRQARPRNAACARARRGGARRRRSWHPGCALRASWQTSTLNGSARFSSAIFSTTGRPYVSTRASSVVMTCATRARDGRRIPPPRRAGSRQCGCRASRPRWRRQTPA